MIWLAVFFNKPNFDVPIVIFETLLTTGPHSAAAVEQEEALDASRYSSAVDARYFVKMQGCQSATDAM